LLRYSAVLPNTLILCHSVLPVFFEEASDNEFEEFWDYPTKEAEDMDMAGMKSLDFE
jgi:hypothetical protein